MTVPTSAVSPVADKPHYGSQTKARKAALDILFSADQRGRSVIETFSEVRSFGEGTIRELTTTLVLGVAEHMEELDARIAASLSAKWTLERMPAVDRNLARIAVYEMDHTATPPATAISEAVRLASDLSTDSSPAFLNGMLRSAAGSSPNHP